MALQTAQVINRDTAGGGLTPAFSAVNASDTIAPSGNGTLIIWVKNGSGGSVNCTVAIPTGRDPITFMPYVASRQYAVPAGQDRVNGPFPASFFADPVTGLITVTYSATPSITAAYFQLVLP